MEHTEPMESEIHYHIKWSDSSIDWEPFPTKGKATERAAQIKKPNENNLVVERNDECERCEEFKSQAASLSQGGVSGESRPKTRL